MHYEQMKEWCGLAGGDGTSDNNNTNVKVLLEEVQLPD